MKIKKLFALAVAMLCTAVTWAQTDVTSTYLTNADFSQSTPLTGTYLYGYGKDGLPYGFQTIEGWTSVVTAGDNSNSSYPNSGMAAGVFAYGSSTQLKGNSKAAPATNPNNLPGFGASQQNDAAQPAAPAAEAPAQDAPAAPAQPAQ